MEPTSLFIGVVTGCIGFAAWQYGRKQQSMRHMGLGFALVGYSWLVDDPLAAGAIGAVLTGLLFYP